jgi:hypothetical protein
MLGNHGVATQLVASRVVLGTIELVKSSILICEFSFKFESQYWTLVLYFTILLHCVRSGF